MEGSARTLHEIRTLQFFEHQHYSIVGNFSDDETTTVAESFRTMSEDKMAAPGKFGRRAESEDWTDEEWRVRERAFATMTRGRDVFEEDDLLCLRLVRGYWTYELSDLVSVMEEVAAWRCNWSCDLYLRKPLPFLRGDFHRVAWPTWVTGRDKYGHLVVLERFETMQWDLVLEYSVEELLRCRIQALDALQREAARISALPGHPRVYKLVFIIDVAGATFSTFMNAKVMDFAKQYAKLTEKMYADAAWTNLVVNAPGVARAAWRVVERVVDEETRDIVKFAPVGDACVGALKDLGLPDDAIPSYLGGSAPLDLLVADLIDRGFDDDDDDDIGGDRRRRSQPSPIPEDNDDEGKDETSPKKIRTSPKRTMVFSFPIFAGGIWRFYDAVATVVMTNVVSLLRFLQPPPRNVIIDPHPNVDEEVEWWTDD